MDLKSFVAETLVQIVEGVADAQKRIAELDVGAAVNPGRVSQTAQQKLAEPSAVEFDVAVTVSDESATRAGVGASAGFLSVVSAKLDAKGEASDSFKNEAVSRIQFAVKLAQPADLVFYDPRPRTINY
jgi:hypothetical protein